MSVYDPKTVVSAQLSTKTDQCFAFLRDGKCRWGTTCRFAHGQRNNSSGQTTRKGKGAIQHVVIEKKKKPKHLKRKLQQALENHDEEKLRELEREQQCLQDIKNTSAKHFKKTCKKIVTKLYGEEAFNEIKFQEYVKAGYSKEKLLKMLRISDDEQKEFKAKSKVTEGIKKIKDGEQNDSIPQKKSKIFSDNHDDSNSINGSLVGSEHTHGDKAISKIDKKSCKKLVKKLYGDERWNESMYDEFVGQGMRGEELLEALGITKRHLKNFK